MRVVQDGGPVGSLSVGWIPTFCELLQAVAMVQELPKFPLRLHSRGSLPFVTAYAVPGFSCTLGLAVQTYCHRVSFMLI